MKSKTKDVAKRPQSQAVPRNNNVPNRTPLNWEKVQKRAKLILAEKQLKLDRVKRNFEEK